MIIRRKVKGFKVVVRDDNYGDGVAIVVSPSGIGGIAGFAPKSKRGIIAEVSRLLSSLTPSPQGVSQ